MLYFLQAEFLMCSLNLPQDALVACLISCIMAISHHSGASGPRLHHGDWFIPYYWMSFASFLELYTYFYSTTWIEGYDAKTPNYPLTPSSTCPWHKWNKVCIRTGAWAGYLKGIQIFILATPIISWNITHPVPRYVQ